MQLGPFMLFPTVVRMQISAEKEKEIAISILIVWEIFCVEATIATLPNSQQMAQNAVEEVTVES